MSGLFITPFLIPVFWGFYGTTCSGKKCYKVTFEKSFTMLPNGKKHHKRGSLLCMLLWVVQFKPKIDVWQQLCLSLWESSKWPDCTFLKLKQLHNSLHGEMLDVVSSVIVKLAIRWNYKTLAVKWNAYRPF